MDAANWNFPGGANTDRRRSHDQRGTPAADFALPVTAMCGLSLAISAIMGIFVGATILIERWGINAILTAPWASWPQYASEAEWRAAYEQERQDGLEASKFTLGPLIAIGVILVIVTALTVFVILPSSGQPASSPLGVQIAAILFILYLLGAVAMNLGAIVQRALIVRRYAIQQRMDIPNAHIGAQGVYDENEGHHSWRWLNDVKYRDKRGDMPASVVFKYYRPASTFRRMPSAEWSVTARVPTGREGEGQMLAERVKSEVLK